MKVLWSPRAIERAHEEAGFIAGDKPEAALAWLDGLFAVVDRLEQFPDSGRVVPELGDPQYREVIYGRSHRVIYRRDTRAVAVLTVRRSRRQLDLSEIIT